MNTGRLLLIRHGETPANIDKVWHGQTDTPLSAMGHKQIAALGKYFHQLMQADVIYASPLQRARLTAEAIAQVRGIEVEFDADLMEFDIGDWENTPYADLQGELGFFKNMMEDEGYCAPGGESRADVTRRFTKAVDRIAQEHAGKNIAIVAHGMALSFALAHWLHNDSAKWPDYGMHNTGVTEFCLRPPSMVSFNLRDHLVM